MNLQNNTIDCPFCGSTKNISLAGNLLKCSLCGLAYKRPYLTVKDVPVFSDGSKDVWLHCSNTIYDKGFKDIEKLMPQKGKILDIGCGYGYFLKLAEGRGWSAEGIELDTKAVEHARKAYNINIYNKPLGELSISPNSYDAVTFWRVLDLLPEPKKDLEKTFNILKPGGIVYIRVYNFYFQYPASRLQQLGIFRKLGIKPGIIHRYSMSAKSLKFVLNKIGYTDIHIENSVPSSGDPHATGGKLGKVFVSASKAILSFIWQAIALFSGGRILLSSSLIVSARKPE